MTHASLVWPLYFARREIRGRRLVIRRGHLFPTEDKLTIRGFGRALGVEDADRRPFDALPYVQVLDVRSEEMARHVRERGLTYDQARKLLEGGDGEEAAT